MRVDFISAAVNLRDKVLVSQEIRELQESIMLLSESNNMQFHNHI